ncbi:hypothetical protein AAG906_016012 [Vitis piasezkii]
MVITAPCFFCPSLIIEASVKTSSYPEQQQPQLMLQQQPQQHRLHHPVQPSFGHLSRLRSQLFNPHLSPAPPIMNKYEAMLGIGDLRDQRPKSMQKARSNHRFSQQGLDTSSRKSDVGWPQFRSKYMTADEIESILRMQRCDTDG